MRLLLIRHGQTFSNVKGYLDTALPGAGLTDLGQQQADALPAALAEERIDAIYASTTLRAQQTAAPLAAARGLDVIVRDGVREVSAGDLEMRSDREAVEIYLSTVLGWANGDLSGMIPGGESGEAVMERFDAVMEEVAASGAESVVVVSHGAMIRSWAAYASADADAAFAASHPLSNTAIVVLEGDPESGWSVDTWGGQPLGGQSVAATDSDGPAADTVTLR